MPEDQSRGMQMEQSLMNIKNEREAVLKAARTIAETAQSERRDLTGSERAELDRLIAKADDLGEKIKAAGESQDRLRRLSAIHDPEADALGQSKSYLGRKSELASGIAKAMSRNTGPSFGSKALITAGDVYADVPLLSADPFAQPRPPASLVDALPVGTLKTPTFTYLRQSTRTNNAAPVAVGAAKPQSAYGLTPVDGKLHVIAHVSEPFDEYWVSDSPGLLRFLEAEMVAGLYPALEAQVLTGDGLGANLTGLANTSGIQTQAFATDVFVSTRRAVTKVESLGYLPKLFVLNPADWEAVETSAFSGGQYVLNGTQGNVPVDAAARRLWGVPVVLSVAQVAGAGWLVSEGAVELVSDGQVKTVTTNAVGTDFTTNQLRMRTESRFELAVTSPMGVVNIDLSAAP